MKARPNSQRVTARIDVKTFKRLADIARRDNVSLSWVTRRAITNHLLRDIGTTTQGNGKCQPPSF